MKNLLKRRELLLIYGMLSLESLLGCAPDKFPQYSAAYLLQNQHYTDPEFAGEKIMPQNLKVINRMSHSGGYWTHLLRFEFQALAPQEASGIALFNLDHLVSETESSFPHQEFKGANVFNEPTVGGVGGPSAFCNYQYRYHLFMEAVPGAGILRRVYPGQGEYIGDDPVTKMPLYLSLSNPKEVELNDDAVEEWYEKVAENKGATLTLIFTRHIAVTRPGGDEGYKDCILPYDPRKTESLIAAYKFEYDEHETEWVEQEYDLRTGDVDGIKENTSTLTHKL